MKLNLSIYLKTMAGHLNTNCDFNSGFFLCNIPRDTIQVVLKIKTKGGKHMLTEGWEKRTEKYRPWEKFTQHVKIGSTKRVETILLRKVHDSGSSLDLGAWVQVARNL